MGSLVFAEKLISQVTTPQPVHPSQGSLPMNPLETTTAPNSMGNLDHVALYIAANIYQAESTRAWLAVRMANPNMGML
jgi:hypothetical protein